MINSLPVFNYISGATPIFLFEDKDAIAQLKRIESVLEQNVFWSKGYYYPGLVSLIQLSPSIYSAELEQGIKDLGIPFAFKDFEVNPGLDLVAKGQWKHLVGLVSVNADKQGYDSTLIVFM